MPAKMKKASSKANGSSEHLHPSSAATAKAAPPTSAGTGSSSSSSSTLTNHATHLPLKTPREPNAYETANAWTWNPIRLIERNLFRTYWNIEGTFVLSMLEAWEVFLVICVFITLTLLLCYTVVHYLPRHASEVANRVAYYVYGTAPSENLASGVAQKASNVTSKVAEATATAGEGLMERLIENSNQLWASLGEEERGKPEVVDRLISNLNKVKQMMGSAGKVEL
uniref:Uncharacterized protein n=2 Tax=Kalmanozyma brasiliensis (strain GHG001) TaxID=1365824 RepID=V5EHR1_KALBG